MENEIETAEDPGPTQEQVDAKHPVKVVHNVMDEYTYDAKSGSLRRVSPKTTPKKKRIGFGKAKDGRRHHGKK